MEANFGAALIALSLTMLGFSQHNGYVPVLYPPFRIYRDEQQTFFWILIAGYAIIGAAGIRILCR